MAAAKTTAAERELKAACARLAKALKGCKPMSQETKDRYYRECEKIGTAAA